MYAHVATVQDDFSEPVPNNATLNQTVWTICSVITTVNDIIVEGEEKFRVRVVLVEKNGSFIVDSSNSEVQIRILDDDCKYLKT